MNLFDVDIAFVRGPASEPASTTTTPTDPHTADDIAFTFEGPKHPNSNSMGASMDEVLTADDLAFTKRGKQVSKPQSGGKAERRTGDPRTADGNASLYLYQRAFLLTLFYGIRLNMLNYVIMNCFC